MVIRWLVRASLFQAKQQNVSSSKESDTIVGTYLNFYMLSEKEGGLMDRDFGIKVASSIATACERKGPPALLWDPVAKCIKYLHCVIGKSEAETKMRQSILSADVEMDPESVVAAMQQGKAAGLVDEIPESEKGKFPVSGNEPVSTAPVKIAKPEEPEVTGGEGITTGSGCSDNMKHRFP